MALATIVPDEPFVKVALGNEGGYIIPQSYAQNHKAELVASIPDEPKIDDFWTPPEQDVRVADRVLRDTIHDAMKNPALLFPDLTPDNPDLEQERNELTLVSQNFENYHRQYVGIIVGGNQLVLCNYSVGAKVDPSTDYIFIQKSFAPGGKMHFLQCRVDAHWKTCTNVSMVGSWQQGK